MLGTDSIQQVAAQIRGQRYKSAVPLYSINTRYDAGNSEKVVPVRQQI